MNITYFAYAQRARNSVRFQMFVFARIYLNRPILFFSLGAAVSELLIHLCVYVCVDHVHAYLYFMSFMCEHRRVWTVQYELPPVGMDENVLLRRVCKKTLAMFVDMYCHRRVWTFQYQFPLFDAQQKQIWLIFTEYMPYMKVHHVHVAKADLW